MEDSVEVDTEEAIVGELSEEINATITEDEIMKTVNQLYTQNYLILYYVME